MGIEILQDLWAHNISAELAGDSRSAEELVPKYRDDTYSWIVIVKQDQLKIKSMAKKDVPDVDLAHTKLLHWLRAEIRERDSRATVKLRGQSSEQAASTTDKEREHEARQDVRVLVAQTKSKKFNRQAVVEQAQLSASTLVKSFLEGPIAAIETTDQIMDQIRATSLSDPESWRRMEQSATTVERKYVREVHDMLSDWRSAYETDGGSRHAFVYNFRSGTCLYYDVGA